MTRINHDCERCHGQAEYAVTLTKSGQKYYVFVCLDENCGHFTYVIADYIQEASDVGL